MHPIYTVDFYINKFSAIPESLWTTGLYESNGKMCAYGHCGVETTEAYELLHLFYSLPNRHAVPIAVNDGDCLQYQQPTPKQRILAALRDIKSILQNENPPEPTRTIKEVIRYVSVSESLKKQTKELIEN